VGTFLFGKRLRPAAPSIPVRPSPGDSTATFDHFAGYHEFFDAFLRRKGIHCVEQQFLEDHHQAAGTDLTLNCLPGDGLERILCKLQLDVIEVKFLLVLLDQSVLGVP
jgi:hypothetical protein